MANLHSFSNILSQITTDLIACNNTDMLCHSPHGSGAPGPPLSVTVPTAQVPWIPCSLSRSPRLRCSGSPAQGLKNLKAQCQPSRISFWTWAFSSKFTWSSADSFLAVAGLRPCLLTGCHRRSVPPSAHIACHMAPLGVLSKRGCLPLQSQQGRVSVLLRQIFIGRDVSMRVTSRHLSVLCWEEASYGCAHAQEETMVRGCVSRSSQSLKTGTFLVNLFLLSAFFFPS